MSDDKVSVGCKVEPEKRRRFRMLAAARDTTMSAIIREFIDDELEDADVDIDAQPHEQLAD